MKDSSLVFIEQVRQEVLNSVTGLTNSQLNWRPEENSWSIIQVLDHLYLMERAVAKGIVSQLNDDSSEAVEDKPIELTVDRSVKVTAPSFVVPADGEMNVEEVKAKLAESRRSLIEIVNGSDAEALESKSYPHPVFGSLNLKQWVPFIGFHEKRHLDQMNEIKEKLNQ
ncbi:hypothetical protein JOC78_000603 [Bacillus ectoiniformans]|uniref:DinB family protein n=1 Tax=Bacillus ectoiniformans TaxID=1494429 RepID=UPI0019580B96|nr:DinB family protein [Bacillus ectoiniformans]MBM7647682.1 hypothetical protein [Bacillus ectoiniformans]